MYNPEKLASQGAQEEEKQGKTPHKDNSIESTKFCETFSYSEYNVPPHFANRGVSNNCVEHLVHNEIEMIGYMVKRVEGRG